MILPVSINISFVGKPFLIAALIAVASSTTAQLQINAVLCNDKTNPIGVPRQQLFFNWELTSRQNRQIQSAFELVISSSKEKLAANDYDVYDSKMIKSARNIMVPYMGQPLLSARAYFYKIKVWDKNQKPSEWSESQQFITALDSGDWHDAEWLSYELLPDSFRLVPGTDDITSSRRQYRERNVVPYFRKEFRPQKSIAKALAFVTGLGQYELEINGQKAGNDFLSPGWTDYEKTVLYNCYDITPLLHPGINCAGMIAGNGFYRINNERYVKFLISFGAPKIICKIILYYTDGSSESIVSDQSWKTAPSPITFTSIYGGEDYDATREQTGWSTAGFDDSGWIYAKPVKGLPIRLLPQMDYPVQIMDTLTATATEAVGGGFLYDFAQNASGIVRLKVKGHKGDTLRLVPGELIDSTKMPNQSASGNPYYYTYILKSDTVEVWQPRFSYYGFRYVWVQGTASHQEKNPQAPELEQIVMLHTRNSTFSTGSFSCNNDLFNKIYKLINWAIKSNLQSVVTDCPHREKLGWLEETHLMGTSIQYNFNIHLLYQQLVHDMIDAQTAEGLVPNIAPELVKFSGGFRDSPEWGSAAILLPWLLYQWYGDETTMALAFPMMKKYLHYLEGRSKAGILSYGLGDWYDYGPAFPGEAQLTPKGLTATAMFYYDALLLSKMAELLNKNEDASSFRRSAVVIKRAFNKKYFDPERNVYSTGSQTAMAIPWCVGLIPETKRKAVFKNLVDSIVRKNKSLTAGDIGYHFLVRALDEGGASQLLFEMNNRDDVAGYGYQLKKGATALTESWQALPNVSNNHLMLGHIMEWFYSGLAGISQTDHSSGFKDIIIRPQPVGDIRWAQGSFHIPYGWIKTHWQKTNSLFSIDLEIPANTSARVFLPGTRKSKVYSNDVLLTDEEFSRKRSEAIISIGSGKYHFEVRN